MIWKFRPAESGEIDLRKGHRQELIVSEDTTISFIYPLEGRIIVLRLIVSPGKKITWENSNDIKIRMPKGLYEENTNDNTDIVYIAFVCVKEGDQYYVDCLGMINNLEELNEI